MSVDFDLFIQLENGDQLLIKTSNYLAFLKKTWIEIVIADKISV